jgi:hypothetical protein
MATCQAIPTAQIAISRVRRRLVEALATACLNGRKSNASTGENMIRKTKNDPVNVMFAMLVALCALFLASCGSGGGSGPAVEKSSMVVGKMAGPKSAQVALAASTDPITVSVLSDPSTTTQVGADGSFTLRGLPAGSFTLVFMQGTTEVGRLTFDEVAPNQQITITVQVVSNELVLVDEDRRGIGDAGVELEGPVQNVIVLNPSGDSRFVIQGREVVARPGITAIRQGETRKTVNDVSVGKQVHVKGTTVPDSTDVLAFEIILQDSASSGAGSNDDAQITICHVPPGNPSHEITITVGASAWPAHQAHGDTKGPCPG